ncbi:XRE family transcriptional regulator [Bacillus sp. DX1.1]|uniref:helix-turn-helix domain-containing protein n=1 Tax=unclassified Bacillus (in: firmicutes) TaxID=185979 RepID=UPI002570E858|nr:MULTISPECIES: XRE family transcriptional regulator [unclassified Bacillus (in: firmicutes)]MDM5156680.1 XRE family transcriptional regulator [Bacillus sp. DX1.1]WJE80935.1 XRE family transcriptional regulator [Bacillus sp. DX3.1]
MREKEDMQTKEVIQQVGQLLRQIRNEQKLSLEELAKKTGVSKLTLGKIERGETNPTLGVIWKITKGLSIPLSRLMVVGETVAISRCGERFTVDEGQAWRLETMFRYTKETGMEMHRACLQPKSKYKPEPHHEGAIELVTVMRGQVSIQVEDDVYELNEFDSMQFEANKKHSYTNNGDEVAVLHLTMKYLA